MIRKILVFLLIVLVLIQFFHPQKNISHETSANDITTQYPVSPEVLSVLKKSCYDCHSNNTVYPWYNNIQPVAWWLNNHVTEGKRELNFSEFGSYTPKKQAHKLHSISGEVKDGGMPLDSYLWIHKDAKLTAQENDLLVKWADSLHNYVAVKNNLPLVEPERPHHD